MKKNTIPAGLYRESALPVPGKSLREQAYALPEKEVLVPHIPIGVFLQEAYNIYRMAKQDSERLIAAGIDWRIVEAVPDRISFLREVEMEVWMGRYSDTTEERNYAEMRKRADRVVRTLIRDCMFIFSDNEEMMTGFEKLKRFREKPDNGAREIALYQTINNEECRARLASVGSDPALIEELELVKDKLRIMYSEATMSRINNRPPRNRAYTLLAVSIGEIRRYARFALDGETKRLKGYASEYFRKSGKKRVKGEELPE